MKFLVLWLLLVSFVHSHELLIKNAQCETSAKRSAEIGRCEFHGRFFTFDINFLRTLDNWKFRFDILQFKDGKFVRVFKFPPIAWCEFTSGKAKLLNFQKLVINGIRRTAPALFHKCPFQGMHKVENVTLSNDALAILPIGKFQFIGTGQDKEDTVLCLNNIDCLGIECTSSGKSSEVSLCKCEGRFITFEVNFIRKLENFKVENLIQKDGKFVNLVKSPVFPWCDVVSGKYKPVGFQKLFIKEIRATTPGLFHKCPFEGLHKFYNVTPNREISEIYQHGVYRVFHKFSDHEDKNIFRINSTFSVHG